MGSKIPWDLIVSKLRQKLSLEEEQRFQEWLTLDNNEYLFKQLELVWDNIQNKVAMYEPDLEYYWQELSARIDRIEEEKIATEKKQPKVKRFFTTYQRVAAVAIVLVLSGVFYYFFQNPTTEETTIAQTYSSITGKSKIMLPDGTEAWLHSNTTLTYKSNSNIREADLDGEAYFNVKHDAKAFVVKTDDISIKVHGTKFNVNSYGASEKIVVSLFEGSVSMNTKDSNVFLKPGEEGHFDKQEKIINVEEGDVEFAKIWTHDKIRFENKTLREVCRYLSKWYGTEIVINASIPDNQSYTFTLKDQSLEEVIRIMSSLNSIDYHYSDNNTIIITSKN